MEKGNSSVGKAFVNNTSDDEEIPQENEAHRMSSANGQPEKQATLLGTIKNFFKNHPLGKNSSKGEGQSMKVEPIPGSENRRKCINPYDELPTKNGENKQGRNNKNTSGQASMVGRRSGGKEVIPQLPCKVRKVFSESNNFRNASALSSNCGASLPGSLNGHAYENLRPPTNLPANESGPHWKALLQRGKENIDPETRTVRERTTADRSKNSRQENYFIESPEAGQSSDDRPQRSSSVSSSDARSSESATTTFRIMNFIQNNVRRLSMPDIHSGGLVLLNDTNNGMVVNFAELRPDTDPIMEKTKTYASISNLSLMSGGSVVFEEYSDCFSIPTFYGEDPIVFDELPENVQLPEPSPTIEITPHGRPILARSCSGGGIVEGDSTKVSLPELFATKKTSPQRPSFLQMSHSGGGLVESHEVQSEIFLDLLSQSLRFDVCPKAPKPAVNRHAS